MIVQSSKKLHFTALACFVLALVFWWVSWLPGVLVAAMVGLFIDALAWFATIADRGKKESG